MVSMLDFVILGLVGGLLGGIIGSVLTELAARLKR